LFCATQDVIGPVGLIHIDAHCDVNEHMSNCAFAHGTTFRRALEDGCLDAKRVVQIGLRGSGHSVEDYAWPMSRVFITTSFRPAEAVSLFLIWCMS